MASEDRRDLVSIFEQQLNAHVSERSESLAERIKSYETALRQDDRQLQEAFGQLTCRIMTSAYRQWAVAPMPIPYEGASEPVRVGFVSAYFRDHSAAKALAGWLRHIDKRRFQIFCYSLGSRVDSTTKAFQRHSYIFRTGCSDFAALCKQMMQDRLHILVFLDIHLTQRGLQLAALRLAPVQCATLSHPVTTGLPTVDYFLASDLTEPVNAEAHYSERLIRLHQLGTAYQRRAIPKLLLSKRRKDFGILDDAVAYLSERAFAPSV